MSARSVQIIGGDNQEDRRKAHVDRFNNAVIVQSEMHANIHRGVVYNVSDLVLGLGNNQNEDLLIIVTSSAHLTFSATASNQATVRFYEDTVVSANGTALAVINRNRFTANTASTAFYRDPTVLVESILPGGTKTQPGSAITSSFAEWNLPPGNYMLRLSNNSGGAEDISLTIEFYEPS